MAALQYVDEPGYHALIVRRTFAQLAKGDTLILRSQHWLARTDATWNEQRKRWTFPSGATLEFGHVEHETSMFDYDGAAFQFIGFDEATSFTERQYEYIGFSRARRTTSLQEAGVPIRTRATGTPGGEGHTWVKRRFLDKREPGVVFIPAKVADNPGLDVDDYAASLGHLPDELRRQLLGGDWGAFEGAAFTVTGAHLVQPFELPASWERFESMDYGLTNPTAWLAHAVDVDGNLVTFGSWYRPGLPSETAPVILRLRQQWKTELCWGDPASLAAPTSTVNRFGQPATIESEFADHGLPVARANNDPRRGFTRLRELLKLDEERRFPDWHPRRGDRGAPRWFLVEAECPELVEQLRTAPLQPGEKRWAGEMIDPVWESAHGHAVAAARYGAMTRPGPSAAEPVEPDWNDEVARRAFLQAQALREAEERWDADSVGDDEMVPI